MNQMQQQMTTDLSNFAVFKTNFRQGIIELFCSLTFHRVSQGGGREMLCPSPLLPVPRQANTHKLLDPRNKRVVLMDEDYKYKQSRCRLLANLHVIDSVHLHVCLVEASSPQVHLPPTLRVTFTRGS